MAKTATKQLSDAGPDIPDFIPEGYEDQSGDILGIWDWTKGHIHFIPQSARIMDSKAESSRPSILVIGKLVEPCNAIVKNEEQVFCSPGSAVGVWVNAGNKKLIHWSGSKVILWDKGKIPVKNRPQPMQDFGLFTAPGSKQSLVTLDGDFRKESREAKTPWDNASLKDEEISEPF